MANPISLQWILERLASDQNPVNYACAGDDDGFIRAPNEFRCRLEWVYMAVEYDDDLFGEILEGNVEDVWLWVDGDEVALPVLYPRTFQLPYVLAAKALQTRQDASERFESREMAEMRDRVQSETPLVRLAAIVWLTLTSEPVKKRQRSWIDKEEWYLADLIRHWWEIWDCDVQNALPHAASLGDFERTMDESGHSCYRDFCAARTDSRESFVAWLHVQSVLFPERAGTPVSLMYRKWGSVVRCGACLN